MFFEIFCFRYNKQIQYNGPNRIRSEDLSILTCSGSSSPSSSPWRSLIRVSKALTSISLAKNQKKCLTHRYWRYGCESNTTRTSYLVSAGFLVFTTGLNNVCACAKIKSNFRANGRANVMRVDAWFFHVQLNDNNWQETKIFHYFGT